MLFSKKLNTKYFKSWCFEPYSYTHMTLFFTIQIWNELRILKYISKLILTLFLMVTQIEYDFSLIDPGPEFEDKHRINGSAMNLNALQVSN